MNSYRKNAIIAGVLFIIATVADLLSLPLRASINASDYLVSVSVNANQVTTAALLLLIGAAAAAGIAVSLYPVLRKYNEGLALGAVGFRLIEATFYMVIVTGLLLFVTLSQEYVQAGAPDVSYFQTLGTLLHGARDLFSNIAVIPFCLGALMYYYIFYQTRLIPRWLSGWGLAGAALCMLSGFLVMFRLIGTLSTFQVVLAFPIAVQEMVLAVWLIVKGFNPSAIASLSAKTE